MLRTTLRPSRTNLDRILHPASRCRSKPIPSALHLLPSRPPEPIKSPESTEYILTHAPPLLLCSQKIMMYKVVFALFAVSAEAFSPTAMPAGSVVARQTVAPTYAPLAPAARAPAAQMSAVTERDADGNPVTHFEMFDPIRLVVQILPWAALLAANPF